MDKKAQGLSTNAIVLIVLGVFVLVVLIAGFTIGWAKILPFLGTDNNVDQVVQQCALACATSSTFDYCKDREINYGEDDSRGEGIANCRGLEFQNIGLESCSLGTSCYPKGGPGIVVINTEPVFGRLPSQCASEDGIWGDASKMENKICEGFRYLETTKYCCR